MRIANAAGRLVVLRDGGGVDVEKASQQQFSSDPQQVFERWEEFRSWAAGTAAATHPVEDVVAYGPPVPRPRQIFAVGLNYRDHAAESDLAAPEFPATFTKFQTSLAGAFDDIELPSDTVDWEVELVVAIGRRAHRVSAQDGWAHVAGLAIGQDLSERTVQLRPPVPQFSLGKSYPGFSPAGPYLMTPDELPDPDDLDISCSINGEQVQSSNTRHMIFSVPTLVEKLSSVCPLLPGDLIFSGTPSGVGHVRNPRRYLRPDDILESSISGLGTMRHRLVAAQPA